MRQMTTQGCLGCFIGFSIELVFMILLKKFNKMPLTLCENRQQVSRLSQYKAIHFVYCCCKSELNLRFLCVESQNSLFQAFLPVTRTFKIHFFTLLKTFRLISTKIRNCSIYTFELPGLK